MWGIKLKGNGWTNTLFLTSSPFSLACVPAFNSSIPCEKGEKENVCVGGSGGGEESIA